MPYGRGGAGNLEAMSQQRPDDVEAQRTKTQDRPAQPASSSKSPSSPTPANLNQDFAHMGRGGAGNWYSPKDLSQTGNFETSAEPISGEAREGDKEAASESRHRGRGGAGNFIWTAEDEERAKNGKEAMEIELKEMVAKDVEEGLARPDRAFIRQWDE